MSCNEPKIGETQGIWENTKNQGKLREFGKTPKIRENSGNLTVTRKERVLTSLANVYLVPCAQLCPLTDWLWWLKFSVYAM